MSASRRRTDRDIRENFIRILSGKELTKITVQELCEAAEINRATFYRYYIDIYDLYDAVTGNFFDRLFNDVVKQHHEEEKTGAADRIRHSVNTALALIEEQKELCMVLLKDTDSVFGFRLLKEIRKIAAADNDSADEGFRLQVSYMSGGILTVILEWIRNDCKPDKESIAAVISRGIKQTFDGC